MNNLFGTGDHLLRDYVRPWGISDKDFLSMVQNIETLNQRDRELIDEFFEAYQERIPSLMTAQKRHIEREKKRGTWRERQS